MLKEAEMLVRLLKNRGLHITFAESCTGGMLASSVVDVPDASSVLDESYVTYANEAKVRLCGVRHETLAAHGAVSEETAREMACGAAKRAGADVAVAVSGIAGPGGGTKEKPVGTVAFAFYVLGSVTSQTVHFPAGGTRTEIRQSAVLHALSALLAHEALQ